MTSATSEKTLDRSFPGESPVLVREAVQVFLLAILLIAPMLEDAVPLCSYIDELAAIALVAWGLLKKDKMRFSGIELFGIFAIVALLVIGFISNFAYGYQSNVFAIFVDAFTCFKLFAAYFGALQVVHGEARVLSIAAALSKLFILIASVFYLFHLSGIIPMGSDRHIMGIACYQFTFGYPTELAAYCVGVSALLMIDSRKNKIWIILDFLLMISTMRAKAVGVAFVVAFFLLRSLFTKGDKGPSALLYLLLVVGVLCLGADQMQFYFGDTASARYLLYSTSFQIALSTFPFGAGFATFASNMSGVFYSPLYYQYGLSTVWGLSPSYYAFTSDAFWPALFGQFGFIGFLLFVGLICSFLYSFVSRSKKRGVPVGAYAVIPIYYLILSTSDAAFFNFYGPFYALVMAIVASASCTKLKPESRDCTIER